VVGKQVNGMLDEGPSALAGYFQVVRVHAADLLGVYNFAPVPARSEQRGDPGRPLMGFGGFTS
jgi:hypothetical protein